MQKCYLEVSPSSSKAMKLWLQDCMPGHWGYSKNGIKHVGVSCSKSNINLQHIFYYLNQTMELHFYLVDFMSATKTK